jgi:uncharacterized paraquat-inducible protein A
MLYILGLTFPVLSTKQQVLGFVLKYKEIGLFDSVRMFYQDKEYFLSILIFAFTILLPVLKFMELTNKLFSLIQFNKKTVQVLMFLDKWSMLDVFLIALLLLNFKMNSNIMVMQLKEGTIFIALSIIVRILTGYLIIQLNTLKP